MELTERGKFTFDLSNANEVYAFGRWLKLADSTRFTNVVVANCKNVTVEFERSKEVKTDATPGEQVSSEAPDSTEISRNI